MSYLIQQLGHVVISSPDPEAAAQDLCSVSGTRISDREDGAIYVTSNSRHHEVTFVKGKGEVVAIGFEAVDDAAFEEICTRIKADGLEILDDKPMGKAYDKALRFVAPGGAVIEAHTAIARNQPARYFTAGPRPRRLEHVNVFADDIPAFGELVEDVFGMKLSDSIDGDGGRWYRAGDRFHHTLAMVGGESKLHHYAFDHYSMEDLMRVADHLYSLDRALVYGPGRHGLGENIFTYYEDQHGLYIENNIEMAHIDCDVTYEPLIWDVSEGANSKWVNKWGTAAPLDFLEGGIKFAAT